MSELKLCVNCEYSHWTYMEPPACVSPRNVESTDLVDGSNIYYIKSCKTQRAFISERHCGPSAEWFVEKPTEVTPEPPNVEEKPIGFFASILKRFTK